MREFFRVIERVERGREFEPTVGKIREEEYWSEGEFFGRRLWDQEGRMIREELVPQE